MENIKGYFDLINKHYDYLRAGQLIMAYEGDITHQLMMAFTQMVEDKLESDNEDETIRRRLYHIMVECLQNINRHSEVFYHENSEYYAGRGAFLVVKSGTHYRVVTVNLLMEKYVENIKKFINEINPLCEQELNEKYKQQLMEGKLSSKGGAGLGFIDIRRKTENKIEFEFFKNDNDTSFFLLNLLISKQ